MSRKNIWFLALLTAILPFVSYFQMTIFNVLGQPLMLHYSLSKTDIALLSAIYIYTDAILLFPAGILIDKFGVKLGAYLCGACMVFAMFLLAFSPTFAVLIIAWTIAGIGNAIAFLVPFRIAACFFQARYLGIILGIQLTIAMFGGIMSQTPLQLLLQSVGLHNALLVTGIIGTFLILSSLIILSRVKAESLKKEHEAWKLKYLWQVLKKFSNYLHGISIGVFSLSLMIFGALWGSEYLQVNYHMSATRASVVVSMVFYGIIIGMPTIPFFEKWIPSKKIIMLAANLLLLMTIMAIYFKLFSSFWLIAGLFLLLGYVSGAQVFNYALIASTNSIESNSAAMGISSFILMAFTATAQLAFTKLLDLHLGNYAIPIGFVIILILINFIIVAAVRENS